jgi:hypothetical protein
MFLSDDTPLFGIGITDEPAWDSHQFGVEL